MTFDEATDAATLAEPQTFCLLAACKELLANYERDANATGIMGSPHVQYALQYGKAAVHQAETAETPEAELQALVDVLAAQNSQLRTQAEILANALNLAVTHGTFSDIIHEHLNEILTRYGTR